MKLPDLATPDLVIARQCRVERQDVTRWDRKTLLRQIQGLQAFGAR